MFLQSIIESIEQHLEESEFDLERLSEEMNMSKSTLYRKIKSMTGLTPLDFVRNIKMKRAFRPRSMAVLCAFSLSAVIGRIAPVCMTVYQ